MKPISKVAAAMTLAAGLIGGSLRADTTIHVGNYTGTSSQGVKGDSAAGNNTVNTTAGAFTPSHLSGDISSGDFNAYCVSLGLTISAGNYSPTGVYTLNTLTNGAGSFFVNSAFTDIGNRLAYLLKTYDASATTKDLKATLQLAIWRAIDSAFVATSGGAVTNGLWTASATYMSGYSANTVYNSNAKFFLTPKPNSSQYQNLIGILPGGDDTHVVPEPSSIAIVAGLIGLGVVGRFRARRKTA